MTKYGCTIENINKSIEKAKDKKDSFYTLSGMGYKVVSGKVTHVADLDGIFERCGNFNVKVGELDRGNFSDSKGKLLKKSFSNKVDSP